MKLPKFMVIALCSSKILFAENTPVGKDTMRENMRAYFAEEKMSALIGFGGALAAGGTGAYLATQNDLSRGIGYPLIGVGVIGLVVGGGVYLRTDSQLRKLESQLDATPADYKRIEGERIRRVNRQFMFLKIAEVSIFTGGVATTVVGVLKQAELTTGVGIGLALDALLLFTFDYFAEARAHLYAQSITDFTAASRNQELIQGLSFSHSF